MAVPWDPVPTFLAFRAVRHDQHPAFVVVVTSWLRGGDEGAVPGRGCCVRRASADSVSQNVVASTQSVAARRGDAQAALEQAVDRGPERRADQRGGQVDPQQLGATG